ncbi:MAG TPA: hypothetical protein VGK43_06320 [Solirubrobacterales bacterium]
MPNPSPTQEVETWKVWRRVYGPENCGPWMLGEPGHPLCAKEGTETVELVPAAALQAEVEKREEVEAERNHLRGLEPAKAWARVSAAESKVSSAAEELEARIARLEGRVAAAWCLGRRELLEVELGSNRAALQLLREHLVQPEENEPQQDGVAIEGDPGPEEGGLTFGETCATLKALETYAGAFPEPNLDSVRKKLAAAICPDPAQFVDLEAHVRAALASTQQQLEQSTTGKEDCEPEEDEAWLGEAELQAEIHADWEREAEEDE